MSLHSEIFEQATVLERLLQIQSETVEKIAEEINKIKPQYVFLAARGTSDNAGRYANYLWGSLNNLPIALATPSLFTYYQKPPLLKGALVLGISQSGQSPDIVTVLEEGRKQGCRAGGYEQPQAVRCRNCRLCRQPQPFQGSCQDYR